MKRAITGQNRRAAIAMGLKFAATPDVEAHCEECRSSAEKMLWSMQTFRATLDSGDYAALNPAYLHQGTAAH